MAVRKSTKARRAEARAKAPARKKPSGPDAISLLEADHQEVDGYFQEYETLTADADKKALATRICLALKVHTQIEEEILYPAAREKTGEADLIDEAVVEHTGAKTLITQIEATQPGMDLYDARVKVLGEQVRHHVQEEETELFPALRDSGIDLDAIGARLAARKAELMALLMPVPVA